MKTDMDVDIDIKIKKTYKQSW